MKLFEEFKLYEHLWESVEAAQALWVNPDGVEIDLADPIAFKNELAAEQQRCQNDLRKRIIAKDQELLRSIDSNMTRLKKTKSEVLDMWTKSHLEMYERNLAHARDTIHVKNNNLHAIAVDGTSTVLAFYNNYYDISNEGELLKYIEAKMKHRGRLGKPALLARAKAEKTELIRKLVKSGHNELVDVAKDKFDAYIKQFELALAVE